MWTARGENPLDVSREAARDWPLSKAEKKELIRRLDSTEKAVIEEEAVVSMEAVIALAEGGDWPIWRGCLLAIMECQFGGSHQKLISLRSGGANPREETATRLLPQAVVALRRCAGQKIRACQLLRALGGTGSARQQRMWLRRDRAHPTAG